MLHNKSMGTLSMDEFICKDFAKASQKEWLLTNGLGGYASSTVAGCNTRRYHGLLVAGRPDAAQRMVLLSKCEETILCAGQKFELSCNQYPGVIHPHGHQYIKHFTVADAAVTWLYNAGGAILEKSIALARGENTTVIKYELHSSHGECLLEVRPLSAFRDYHALTHENNAINADAEKILNGIQMTPYSGFPPLYFSHLSALACALRASRCNAQAGADSFKYNPLWYKNFEYVQEKERGLDFQEDLFSYGVFCFQLRANEPVFFVASCDEKYACTKTEENKNIISLFKEGNRAGEKKPSNPHEIVMELQKACGAFIVQKGSNKTVIAGYHWFTDWGRDTMIVLRGLTLCTERYDDAKNILLSFAQHVSHGMLPNVFPDAGETPHYNTVDAALWYFDAIFHYYGATHDADTLKKLFPVLEDIVQWHKKGTRFHIQMDKNDFLIYAGEKGEQLTWMDAKIGGVVVTPRTGKPVEINALWYNAVKIMEHFSKTLGHPASAAKEYAALAKKIKENFLRQFWSEEKQYLYDIIDAPDGNDDTLRPNQIFALSIAFPVLTDKHKAKKVVDIVNEKLLTPYGLRTLSPDDVNYKGIYTGGVYERDTAYHQGTVWPWLLGHFADAHFRVYKNKKKARNFFAAFEGHLYDAGLGHISEIFDGDPPHHPQGCIAQAWSVSEILRGIKKFKSWF